MESHVKAGGGGECVISAGAAPAALSLQRCATQGPLLVPSGGFVLFSLAPRFLRWSSRRGGSFLMMFVAVLNEIIQHNYSKCGGTHSKITINAGALER